MKKSKIYSFFKSELTSKAIFCGNYDMPYVVAATEIPRGVITFEKALRTKNPEDLKKWVVFYMEDYAFERIWNNPKKYIGRLKQFAGVVTPDFSICADMPYPVKIMNSYRSKVLGVFFNDNGIRTIPNVRWCDEESLKYCIDGIERNSNIFVGTLGCKRSLDDRKLLVEGFDYVCDELRPRMILSYGSLTDEMINICKRYNIPYKEYSPQITEVFKEKKHGA